MELATGPLPSRPPAAPLPDHHVDAWGDFLRRFLVLADPGREAQAVAGEAPPGGDTLHPPAGSRLGIGLAAE